MMMMMMMMMASDLLHGAVEKTALNSAVTDDFKGCFEACKTGIEG
jgi:hypothetical protein